MELDDETRARIDALRQWCRGRADLRDEDGNPSPSKLAERTGKTPQYWSDVLREVKSFGSKAARNAEIALGMERFGLESPYDLILVDSDLRGSVVESKLVHPSAARRKAAMDRAAGLGDMVIRQFDAGGAMGHGVHLPDQPGVIHSWKVSPEWVQKNVRGYTSVSNLCIVTGFGDSMRPLYNPGDPLLVDRGARNVDIDAVFFFRVGADGFIKRLQRIPGQGLIAISENPRYREWTINQDMDFEVFGRVLKVWCSSDF